MRALAIVAAVVLVAGWLRRAIVWPDLEPDMDDWYSELVPMAASPVLAGRN